MSRRQRRRATTGSGAKPGKAGGRWLIRVLIVGMGLAVVAMGGSYLWLRGWLHSDAFRRMLAGQADGALQVSSEFGLFRWGGTRMDTESFTATGKGLIRNIDADDLRVEVGLGGWWKGAWRIDDASARRIEVEIDATAADRMKNQPAPMEAEAPPPEKKESKWYDALIPHEVELRQLQISSSTVRVLTGAGPVGIANTSWKVTPDTAKGSYRAEAKDGTVQLPWEWAPPMRLGKARLRYQGNTAYLTSADFEVYKSGRLDMDGEMSVKGEGYTFNGQLRDVACAEILPESWRQRLSGKVASDFTVEGKDSGPVVSGELELTDGLLTALPILDSLSAYADTTRFRRIALQEGKTDYEWEDGNLTLRNLVLSSEGLVRLEGDLKMDSQQRLDGRFRLGIIPGILAKIPGAETQVFRREPNGMLWTDLHITGTFDDPKEDLSGRLVEAAGLRMFEVLPETGEQVMKFTKHVIDQDLQAHLAKAGVVLEQGKAAIEQGKQVIDQGTEAIKGAAGTAEEVGKGLFDILGGGGKEKKEE